MVDFAAIEPTLGIRCVKTIAFGKEAGEFGSRCGPKRAIAAGEGCGGLPAVRAQRLIVDPISLLLALHGGIHIGKMKEAPGNSNGKGI